MSRICLHARAPNLGKLCAISSWRYVVLRPLSLLSVSHPTTPSPHVGEGKGISCVRRQFHFPLSAFLRQEVGNSNMGLAA
jgi:hypothetical protein